MVEIGCGLKQVQHPEADAWNVGNRCYTRKLGIKQAVAGLGLGRGHEVFSKGRKLTWTRVEWQALSPTVSLERCTSAFQGS